MVMAGGLRRSEDVRHLRWAPRERRASSDGGRLLCDACTWGLRPRRWVTGEGPVLFQTTQTGVFGNTMGEFLCLYLEKQLKGSRAGDGGYREGSEAP